MILNGKKRMEFREAKPYWQKRLQKVFAMKEDGITPQGWDTQLVWFRNGYNPSKSPTFVALCHCLDEIKDGKKLPKSLGAENNKQYYVLVIDEIRKTFNVDPTIINNQKGK